MDKEAGVRLKAFQELEQWQDQDFTKEKFMKNSHIFLKEKDEAVLLQLL